MSSSPIRVLLIEDNPADAIFIQEALDSDPFSLFDMVTVERLGRALSTLRGRQFDVVLLDLGLPDSQGLDSFHQLHAQHPDLPVVVLSGLPSESRAIDAVHAGAQDYLIKGQAGWQLTPRAVRYAIERQQSRAALQASERRFRGLIEHSTDGIALLAVDGTLLYESPSVKAIMGYMPEDLIGRNGFELIHPDDAPGCWGVLRQIQDNPRSSFAISFRFRHSDGDWRWLDTTGTNLLDEPGVQAIVLNYRDVTRRRQAEDNLQRSEQHLRALLSTTMDGLWIVDIRGRFVDVNEAYCAMSGYTRDELLQLSISDLEDIETAAQTAEHMRRIITRRQDRFETRHRRKDGSAFDVEASVTYVDQDGGQVVAFCRDITEQQKARAAIQERLKLQDQLSKIAATVPGMIATLRLHPDGSMDMPYASAALDSLYGLQSEDVLHDAAPALSRIDPDDRAHVGAAMQESARRLTPFRDEWRVRHPRRGAIWVEGHTMPQREPDGTVAWHGFIQDITERKAAEATLATERIRLRTLINTVPDMIWLKDPRGVYLLGNPTFLRFAGLDEAGLLGKTDFDIFDREEAEMYCGQDRAAIAAGRPTVQEDWAAFRSGGDRMLLEKIKTPMLDDQGQLMGVLGIARDITDRKQAEAQIRDLNAELERRVAERTAQLEAANRELEAFTYSISHDLRAPLRAIDGFSGIILDDYAGQLGSEGRRLLGIVRSNAQRMNQLIIALLDLSRASQTELRLANIDMAALARAVYAETIPPDAQREFDFSVGDLPDAWGDATLIRQVWANLLSNAVKYTRASPIRRIEVGGHVEQGLSIYHVADTGAGFDPRQADRLFGVFQRLHRQADFEGNGVGLAIVQRIVHRHGGRAWAESQVGQGSTFFFSLPASGAPGAAQRGAS